jgi:membrane-associated phospholipid phosphatase
MEEWLYDWGGLNVALFHAINAKHAAWLDRLMLALTWAGDHDRFPLYLAVLALVTWWRFSRDPESPSARASMLALATFSIGYLLDGMLVIGLKSAFDFPRPPAVLPADSLVIIGPPELRHSFPSGHASFAMLVAAVLWPEAKNLATRIALALFVAGVCLSRPYLGMHFPADVLFGSLISLLVVIAIRATLTRWMPAGRG